MIRSIRFIALASSLLAAFTLTAQQSAAQQNNEHQEFAVTIGALSGTNPSATLGPLALGSGFALQANYARKTRDLKWANLYWEVNGLYNPLRHLSGFPPTATSAIHSIYVTPGLRLQFTPDEKISPWLAAGGGFAFYDSSKSGLGGGAVAGGTANTGVVDFGGGVDIAMGKSYLLRGGVRGFYTGSPNFDTANSGGQFNFVISGGIVWRFPK
jgi:hypothetical protein